MVEWRGYREVNEMYAHNDSASDLEGAKHMESLSTIVMLTDVCSCWLLYTSDIWCDKTNSGTQPLRSPMLSLVALKKCSMYI